MADEDTPIHAHLGFTSTTEGINVQLVTEAPDDDPSVRFARWICDNLSSLLPMCEREIGKLVERPEIVTEASRRLVGADGKPLQ